MIKLDYTVASRKVNNKIKKTWENQTWLNYENLLPVDKINIKEKFKGYPNNKNGNSSIGLSTTKPEDPENPKTANIINSLKYLESTGNYEMPSIDSVLVDLVSASNDVMSDEEKANVAKSTDEMWLKFMKEIEKPEVQLLLKSFGQYALTDSTFGWQLASSNLMRIKAQKSDATFVQTRRQWHDRFGRRVIPNAKKIGVIVPINNSSYKNQDDKKDMMKKTGYGDNVSYGDLSTQQQVHIDVSMVAGEGKGFRLMTFYDVSDTELIDPSGPDKWAEEVGSDNNLTGHLNQAALNFKASQGSTSPEEIAQIYNNEEGNIILLTNALAKGIETSYPDLGTAIPRGNNKNAYLKCYHEMLEKLADRLIEEKSKIVKKENRQQGIAIATTIVMCLTKVSPELVARKLANNELTEDSYFELRVIINSITWMIRNNLPKMESKKKLYEFDIPTLNSVDELLGMMGMNMSDVRKTNDINQEPTMENTEIEISTLKENFYNLFNRINQIIL